MKAKFTGHDTFSLRYGWLYKAVNHLKSEGKLQTSDNKSTRKAIVALGVGKNMVNAIRYWADSVSLLNSERSNTSVDFTPSEYGTYLFDSEVGKDPFLEQVGSIWLVHFWLNFNFEFLSAYRYFFNYSHVQHFEKSKLVSDCLDEARSLVTNEVGNDNTIKKDIDCFLNSYCKKFKSDAMKKKLIIDEDHFTSPLSELGLIHDNGGGFYISDLTERPEIPVEVFIHALIRFIKIETIDSKINSIDFDSLLTKPCSPGRIFRLSESGLGQKLDEAQEVTAGEVHWIDSLGLRQVKIEQSLLDNPLSILNKFYGEKL
jgi:hypothetical protein